MERLLVLCYSMMLLTAVAEAVTTTTTESESEGGPPGVEKVQTRNGDVPQAGPVYQPLPVVSHSVPLPPNAYVSNVQFVDPNFGRLLQVGGGLQAGIPGFGGFSGVASNGYKGSYFSGSVNAGLGYRPRPVDSFYEESYFYPELPNFRPTAWYNDNYFIPNGGRSVPTAAVVPRAPGYAQRHPFFPRRRYPFGYGYIKY